MKVVEVLLGKHSNMDDKKAMEILLSLLKKALLNQEEREAVEAAIGILSWTVLSKSRIKAQKEKGERRRAG
jgi:hypothetical protein